MKKIMVIPAIALLAAILGACSAAPPSPAAASSAAVASTAAASTQAATAAPTPSPTPTAEPTPEPVTIDIQLVKSELAAASKEGLYGIPYEESIIYSVNNVIDGSMQMKSAPDNLIVYNITYTLKQAETADVSVKLTLPDGTELTRSKETALGNEGENKIIVFCKTEAPAPEGEYTLEFYVGGGLLDTQTCTK